MTLTKAALAAVLLPALLAGCATAPSRPHMSQPVAGQAQSAALDRARIRDLRAEVVGQISYLETHLGRDRSDLLDMGDSLLVTLPGAGAFEGRTDRLTPSGIDQVARIAASMLAYPYSRMTVIGHVEGSMSDYSDKILSDRRAVAIKSVLMSRGVDACRIGVLGKGSSDPIATPYTNREDQHNNRMEIMIKPVQDGACG
ncbi:outer membrane protein OmpA-like peptidoglycan-associated protein [Gemmobacter caeni]|uniref:Outer membrane protein OmpA-like peptidoglycan-associated protein n=1 Tax=Gemmobacter caeni TaxID=589035 RepID=A0A2T6B8T8_9RHOB|nr:OmpA family protein [Gemmobacter caeni]PTX52473.1 outer membrane protein OmpA-like peptidoglycan-associated protein [Gemmobacter caeni]TWJ02856.1 outer membrane protein OmpA-like peptidoglycan-associated protein [Gemmobacter caeni]